MISMGEEEDFGGGGGLFLKRGEGKDFEGGGGRLGRGNKKKNIATGETSQDITPFHFFHNFNFHH